MKKYILAVTAICALFFSACTSQLDIPQKGVVAYETYYTSDEAAEAALVNVYAKMVQNVYGSIGNWNPYFFMMNYSADDVFAAGKNKDDHLDVRLFNEYRYDASYEIIKRVYTSIYQAIYACNLLIDNFTKEGAYSSPVVDRCVAEARVVRAWLHMTAALTWQRPPLVDHCLTDEDPTNVESQKFLLDWCINECALALPNLRERSSKLDKDATTYVTKGFAQFVAGKSAVFANEMDVARKYLGDLIASGKYELVPGDRWWENFHTPGDGNEEKIFEPNWVYDSNNSSSDNQSRAKWNQNNTLNWRGKNMNSWPVCQATTGWNGGAINGYFADKFLEHDGNGPRRMGTFFTADEWLYGIDSDGNEIFDKFPWMRWDTDYVGNNHTSGQLKPASEWTLADKKKDPKRGMNANGFFGRTYYMNWKFMSLNGIDV
ncbi:MAG: RagB/SusD family nutrient uptake outer membrane protein, partial [Bacteroidales bacterium]|nr:RagB/SusD family nutrient uptake outer membrane protein [Bacteroidales bacterium]